MVAVHDGAYQKAVDQVRYLLITITLSVKTSGSTSSVIAETFNEQHIF